MISWCDAEWNFAYVLPQAEGEPIHLVFPSALQMWWCESPPFFCSASETTRDVAADTMASTEDPEPHPLEEWMVPPNKWPEENLGGACEKFLNVLECYVDDFCSMV